MKNLDHVKALSSLVLVGTCAVALLSACSATDSIGTPGDGGRDPACSPPNVWRYQEPGCGAEAHPVCADGMQDACWGYACGCDGEILIGCDYYTKPWRSEGACPDACFSPTQNLDLAEFLSLPGCSCDTASATPQCLSVGDRNLLLSCMGGNWRLGECPGDGGPPDGHDGGWCQPPNEIRYQTPGCGAAAVAVCYKAEGDMAMRIDYHCACDGVTTLMNDVSGSREPFLYSGTCRQDGGSTTREVPSDAPPTVFCNLADGRRIQAGAAFSDGCNCCVCMSDGRAACQGASCRDAAVEQPSCTSDDDCLAHGRSLCVFEPGCAAPRGTCLGGAGICPTSAASDLAPFEYCGCDGTTYAPSYDPSMPRMYPYKPYQHFGACTATDPVWGTGGSPGAGGSGGSGGAGGSWGTGGLAFFTVPNEVTPQSYTFPLPAGIVAGPDGNAWFTASGTNKIGRITSAGTMTLFPATNSSPEGITAGPDGNVWFTMLGWVGRITPAGVVTTVRDPSALGYDSFLARIAAGTDGYLYMTDASHDAIHVMTSSGTGSSYPLPRAGTWTEYIVAGPDGGAWFTESLGNRIGHISADGVINEIAIPTADSYPNGLAFTKDGKLWFAEGGARQIGCLVGQTISEFPIPGGSSGPTALAAAPDGSIWFTLPGEGKLTRMTPSGEFSDYSLPTSADSPTEITVGADGIVWFIADNTIGRLIP